MTHPASLPGKEEVVSIWELAMSILRFPVVGGVGWGGRIKEVGRGMESCGFLGVSALDNSKMDPKS